MLTFLSVFVAVLIIIPLILALPTISIDVTGVINGSVYSFIRAGAYLLPMSTFGVLLTITFGLFVFRMIVAVIKAVKAVLL